MHGIPQGLMEAGRNAGRVVECGGQYDAMTITWFVLGIALWAAVMTILVMGMIALVKYLKKPKTQTSDK